MQKHIFQHTTRYIHTLCTSWRVSTAHTAVFLDRAFFWTSLRNTRSFINITHGPCSLPVCLPKTLARWLYTPRALDCVSCAYTSFCHTAVFLDRVSLWTHYSSVIFRPCNPFTRRASWPCVTLDTLFLFAFQPCVPSTRPCFAWFLLCPNVLLTFS